MNCEACKRREAVSDAPALCEVCWENRGYDIEVGRRVICVEDRSCDGVVQRFEDSQAVIACADGVDAYIPTADLVRVRR